MYMHTSVLMIKSLILVCSLLKITYADLQEFSAPTDNEQKSAATFDTTTAYAELLM